MQPQQFFSLGTTALRNLYKIEIVPSLGAKWGHEFPFIHRTPQGRKRLPKNRFFDGLRESPSHFVHGYDLIFYNPVLNHVAIFLKNKNEKTKQPQKDNKDVLTSDPLSPRLLSKTSLETWSNFLAHGQILHRLVRGHQIKDGAAHNGHMGHRPMISHPGVDLQKQWGNDTNEFL